jgi:hypothetical protein
MTSATVTRQQPRSARRTSWGWWVARMLLDILAEPVRRGRLRGNGWHPGLRAVVTMSLVIYLAAFLLLATAPLVRAHDELVVVGSISLPRSTVFFFVAVMLWCLALLQAASLHAPVWLRLGALVLVSLTMGTFSVTAGTSGRAWIPCALGVLGLVVLTAVRWRRSPAWWEVPACLCLVAGPSLVALALGSARMQSLGADGMPLVLSLQMQRLNALAMPAALVGGAAVAELAVSTADKVARTGVRFPRILLPVVLALGTWRLVEVAATAQRVGTTTHRVWVEWLGGAALLTLAAAWGWWLVRTAHRPANPSPGIEDTADEVGTIGPAVALGLLALLLPSMLLVSLRALLAGFNQEGSLLGTINEHLITTTSVTWWRVAVGLALLVFALRVARRRQVVRALLVGEIGLVLVLLHIGMASDGRLSWPWTVESVVDVAATAALLGFVWLAVRRSLTTTPAAVLGTIVVLPWAFRFSDVIDAPFVTLLGLSGIGVTLFGLVWGLATGGADANGDSVRYPRQSRVLLFLAQAVYGLLALVYSGVVRGGSGLAFSPSDTSELGAQVIGVPLVLSALVVMVWRMAKTSPAPGERATEEG